MCMCLESTLELSYMIFLYELLSCNQDVIQELVLYVLIAHAYCISRADEFSVCL